jgi:outer membrane protein
MVIIAMIACKSESKKAVAESDGTDTIETLTDVDSIEIDSSAPIVGLEPIKGIPAGTKIVWLNIDTLQEKYQYFIDENKIIMNQLQKLDSDVQSRERAIMSAQTAFQKRLQELQSRAEMMSPNEIMAAQSELEGKEKEIISMNENYQKFKESKQMELLKKQEATNKKIKKRIDVYLEKLAESQGFDFILTYSDITNPVLFGTKKLDITKAAIEGLNKDYQLIKK